MRVERYRTLKGFKMVKLEPALHLRLKAMSKANGMTISETIERMSKARRVAHG